MSAWDNVDAEKKTVALLTARLLKEENMNKFYERRETSDAEFLSIRTVNYQRPSDSVPNVSSQSASQVNDMEKTTVRIVRKDRAL